MFKELTKKQQILINSIMFYNPENIASFFTVFLKETVTNILVDYIDKEMYEKDLMNIKDKIRIKIYEEKLNNVYISDITAYYYMPYHFCGKLSVYYLRLSIMLHCENSDIIYNWGNF